jgi:NTP pyrophosphatase (non-canonical NTP hydrolase)
MILSELQAEIGKWGEDTFGAAQGDVVGLKLRLRQEMDELDIALAKSGNTATDDVGDEGADVGILLLGLFHQLKIDLGAAIARKMQINRARKWPRDRSIPDIVPARIRAEDPT